MVDPETTQSDVDEHDDENMSTDVPLLDFSEAVERERIPASKGGSIEIRNLGEFGLLEEHKLQHMRNRFMRMQEKEKLTPAEQRDYERLLDELYDKVAAGPDEAKGSLNSRQKQQVVAVFTATQLGEDAALTQKTIEKTRRGNDSMLES